MFIIFPGDGKVKEDWKKDIITIKEDKKIIILLKN
jgi:hypothetical protein